MSSPFSGTAYLEAARTQRDEAKSVAEFRQALAVLLPLELGISLEQAAQVLGRSKSATCTLRTRFVSTQINPASAPRSKHTLRNRAKASLSQEAQALDEVLAEAAQGGVVTIPMLKPLLEKKLGHTLGLTTVYRMLHRHGWRKLAPDTAHPKGDAQAREAWKKNSAPMWRKLP